MIKDKIVSAWFHAIQWIKDHLIEDAVDWWRLWSVRLNAIGFGLLAWIQIDPVSVLGVWNMMPASLQQVVPSNIFQLVAVVLFALGMLARVVRQPKLEERHAERAAAKHSAE